MDPSDIVRTYSDVDKIVKSQPEKFKTIEEKAPDGRFKAYYVSTD